MHPGQSVDTKPVFSARYSSDQYTFPYSMPMNGSLSSPFVDSPSLLTKKGVTLSELFSAIVSIRHDVRDDFYAINLIKKDKLIEKAIEINQSGTAQSSQSSHEYKEWCDAIAWYFTKSISLLKEEIDACIGVNNLTKARLLYRDYKYNYLNGRKLYTDILTLSQSVDDMQAFHPVETALPAIKEIIRNAESEKIILQLRRRLADPAVEPRVRKATEKVMDAVMKMSDVAMSVGEKREVLESVLMAIQPELKELPIHASSMRSLPELAQRYKSKTSRPLQVLASLLLAVTAAIIAASVLILPVLVPPVLAVVIGGAAAFRTLNSSATLFGAAQGGKDTELSTSLTLLQARTALI